MIYFIQTQPSPREGAHAQECTRRAFLEAALREPAAPIEGASFGGEHGSPALYLRCDRLVSAHRESGS